MLRLTCQIKKSHRHFFHIGIESRLLWTARSEKNEIRCTESDQLRCSGTAVCGFLATSVSNMATAVKSSLKQRHFRRTKTCIHERLNIMQVFAARTRKRGRIGSCLRYDERRVLLPGSMDSHARQPSRTMSIGDYLGAAAEGPSAGRGYHRLERAELGDQRDRGACRPEGSSQAAPLRDRRVSARRPRRRARPSGA